MITFVAGKTFEIELLHLSPAAARVLGCLIERGRAKPEHYPRPRNALVAACNHQKTSRDPVAEFGADVIASLLGISSIAYPRLSSRRVFD